MEDSATQEASRLLSQFTAASLEPFRRTLSALFSPFTHPPRVLVVEDSRMINRRLVSILDSNGFETRTAMDGKTALDLLRAESFDAVLLDFHLPDMTGLDILRELRVEYSPVQLPVIFYTSDESLETLSECLREGANDFLRKTCRPEELILRLLNSAGISQMSRRLEDVSEIIMSMSKILEEHDMETSEHCLRLSRNAVRFGNILGLPPTDLEALRLGGPLHDIGKICISDAILRAPRKLTPEEWEVMKTHTVKGYEICRNLSSLQGVLPIIRNHHERWDGSGYPDGLKGEEIPLLAQVFQLIDIHDALAHTRAYKEAMPRVEIIRIFHEERDKGWRNPELVAEFLAHLTRITAN